MNIRVYIKVKQTDTTTAHNWADGFTANWGGSAHHINRSSDYPGCFVVFIDDIEFDDVGSVLDCESLVYRWNEV